MSITTTVNGSRRTATVEPRRLLVDVLREDFGLTGTHIACEQGACGACTVLVDGEAVLSCLMLAVQADGRQVTTVEGLDRDGKHHPLQDAFSQHHGLQCGFCTPGMILSAIDLLSRHDTITPEVINDGLSGNLCRCTGYSGIADAVMAVARADGAVDPAGQQAGRTDDR